jgi:hypothetical protein
MQSRGHREPPPEKIFTSLETQLANVRRWNEEREWGFTAGELAAVDLTPARHTDPLVVDVIVPYLPSDRTMDGVRRTCHELWTLAEREQPFTWAWDHRRADYPKPVRLLAGIEHTPGVRRVTLDLGAHWLPGRYLRPMRVRGRDSAHAEVLAAAAHFPDWVRAMDGRSVPYIWLSGYQVTIPERSIDVHLPVLAWVRHRRQMSLTAYFADHAHSGFASPVRIEAPPDELEESA